MGNEEQDMIPITVGSAGGKPFVLGSHRVVAQ